MNPETAVGTESKMQILPILTELSKNVLREL